MKNLILLSVCTFLTLTSMNTPTPTPFKVDVAKSTFKWTGKKVAGTHWGYIKFSEGSLQLEKGILKGGSFDVDMTTIDCQDTQGEWGQKLVGHLKADDFFGADKFPKSTLVIKTATSKGANQYDVVADLTIKGISQEISFPATVTVDGLNATATANFNVNRTQYGIKYGSGSFFQNLGDKAIDDNFNVEVNLVATTTAPEKAKTKKKSAKKSAASHK
jgi:polyisoprenoid-binding protein YceI